MAGQQPDQKTHLHGGDLKKRGWTEAMIRDLLGDPDKREKMPYRKHPLRLWCWERVRDAEASEGFERRRSVAERRSSKAKKTAQRKRSEMAMRAERVHIKVDWPESLDEARRLAVADKQHWYNITDRWYLDASSAPAETIDRWVLNYVRHRRTHYDGMLWEARGKVGVNEFHDGLRARIDGMTRERYPDLLAA